MIKKVLQGLTLGSVLLSSLLYITVPRASASPDVDWLDRWDKRVKITINSTNINATLTNFPVLIYLSTNSGENAEDVSFVFDELGSDANRKKIAVTTSNGTDQCYVEIEEWIHANEQAWLWAKVPNVASNADTDLYIYYDKGRPDNTNYVGDTGDVPAENAWDTNFVIVQHLEEAAGTVYDSTINNNDGTPSPTADPDFDINSCDDITDWAGTSLSTDTVDKIEGNASLVDTVQSPTNDVTYTNAYNPAGSWDFGNRNLNFWFKSSRSNANFNSARVYVYDTNSPANWRYHDLTFNTNIWKRFNVGISSGGTPSATSPASNAIDRIEWQFAAADTVEFTNKIDMVYANGGPLEVSGKIGMCQQFDDIDDTITILDDDSLDVPKVTIEGWLYVNSWAWGQFGLITKGWTEQYNLMRYYQDGRWQLIYNDGTGYETKSWVSSDKSLDWHHICVTYDAPNVILYDQGVSQGTLTSTKGDLTETAGNFVLHTSQGSGLTKMDEVRISSIARSAEWIKASYETQRDHLLDFGVEENRPIVGTVMSIR